MGKAGDAESLLEVIGELRVGTAQNQSDQKATPPRTHFLLQLLGNIEPQSSQKRPWTLQHVDDLAPARFDPIQLQ